MRVSGAAKQIQHIASLGLRSQIAIPEMLKTLGDIIPGSFNSFFWVDRHGMLQDAYAPQVVLSAFDAFVGNYAALGADEPTFDKIVAVGSEVGSALRVHAMRDYSRSVLCNEVWRPYGIGCGLDLVLRENGEARGILFVNREARNSRFTAREHQTLASLAPHFLHALTGPIHSDVAIDDTEECTGVLVVDAEGAVLSSSSEGLRLMHEMTDRPYGPSTFGEVGYLRLPPFLQELLRRHRSIRNGELSPPPRTERNTRRGYYRARAFPHVDGVGAFADHASYSVIISQHLPSVLRLSRQLASLGLSPREREVAFRLGMGEDADQGAAAIGVSVTTWRSYVKRVYQRLDIGSRGEFHALLQGARAPTM